MKKSPLQMAESQELSVEPLPLVPTKEAFLLPMLKIGHGDPTEWSELVSRFQVAGVTTRVEGAAGTATQVHQ